MRPQMKAPSQFVQNTMSSGANRRKEVRASPAGERLLLAGRERKSVEAQYTKAALSEQKQSS